MSEPIRTFATALTELFDAAGRPTRQQIVAYGKNQKPPVQLTPSVIGEWLSGASVPARPQTLACLVRYLQLRADHKPDTSTFEVMRKRAEAAKNQNRRTTKASRQSSSTRLGTPVRDLTDPAAFGIHPAIDSGPVGLDRLTTYVTRPLDTRLADVVRAAADGTSQAVVVVGESSTGKTRACWETIQDLPDGWWVWDPLTVEAAVAALDKSVPPRTVIWLDNAHNYFSTADRRSGEQLAAALRSALRDPDRSPTLVIAMMWPDQYDCLVREPDGTVDPHAHARMLLSDRVIDVPLEFDGPALEHARTAGDPRLAEAAARAENGRVIQYLGGIPALLDRYRRAGAAQKAVLHAAMDLRRVESGPVLCREVLEAAALGYASEVDRPPGWFERAVDGLVRPRRGTSGPLIPVPPDRYRLADHLEQLGRSTRTNRIPKTELWQALLDHGPGDQMIGFGHKAARCGLSRLAVLFFHAAVVDGITDGLRKIGAELARAGRLDEAIVWLERAVHAGDNQAIKHVVQVLGDMDRVDEIEQWCTEAETGGAVLPDLEIANALARHDLPTAITWFARAHEKGEPSAAFAAAQLLERLDDTDQAIVWYERAVAKGDLWATARLTAALAAVGRTDDALRQLDPRLQEGSEEAVAEGGRILLEARGIDAAVTWVRAQHAVADPARLRIAAVLVKRTGDIATAQDMCEGAVAQGDVHAMQVLARMLEEQQQLDEALRYFRMAAAHNKGTTQAVTRLLTKLGRADEILDWLRSLRASGHPRVTPRLMVWHLIRSGDIDGALAEVRALADAGDHDALTDTALTLLQAGHTERAFGIFDEAVAAGHDRASERLADAMAKVGRTDDAITRFQQLADTGAPYASERLTALLTETGRIEEAIAWLRSRAEAGDDQAWRELGALYRSAGHVTEASDAYHRAMDGGDRGGLWQLAKTFEDEGRVDDAVALLLSCGEVEARFTAQKLLSDRPDAERLRKYGIEPDGRIAEPWDVPPLGDAPLTSLG